MRLLAMFYYPRHWFTTVISHPSHPQRKHELRLPLQVRTSRAGVVARQLGVSTSIVRAGLHWCVQSQVPALTTTRRGGTTSGATVTQSVRAPTASRQRSGPEGGSFACFGASAPVVSRSCNFRLGVPGPAAPAYLLGSTWSTGSAACLCASEHLSTLLVLAGACGKGSKGSIAIFGPCAW